MSPLLFVLGACAPPPPPPPQPPPVPEGIEQIGRDQLRSRLVEAPGYTRVVNFWATWCGPCKAELPHLKAFAESHPEVDVVLVNLDMPKLRDNTVMPYLRDAELLTLRHWQLDDPDPKAALHHAVPDWPDMVPVTLVIDGTGQITERFARALGPADFAALP